MSSFKSNENIHKKEDGPYYVVSVNKASSVTLTILKANINIIIHGAVLKYNLAKILKVIEVVFSTCKTNRLYDKSKA